MPTQIPEVSIAKYERANISASAAQATEVTIRKTFKDIKNRLELND